MTDSPVAVVVGPDAHALRRLVGPTAWVVLETTLAVARSSGDQLVAEVSVRQLATMLGLAKNTVARALLVLRRAQLVAPVESRTSDGAFACGRYAIDVPCAALAPVPALDAAPRVVRSSRRVRPAGAISVEQLALLPE